MDIGAEIGLLDNKLAGLVANLVARVGQAVVDMDMNMDNIHSASLGNTDSDIAALDMVLVVLVLVLVLVLNWSVQNRLLKLIQVLVVVV